jgi:hypothetical protein
MNKTASQIGDIIMTKLSVSPEIAQRALLKRLLSSKVGVGDPRRSIDALDRLVFDAPRAVKRALGVRPPEGSTLKKNTVLQPFGDLGELFGVKPRYTTSPSGEYIERLGRIWGKDLLGKLG